MFTLLRVASRSFAAGFVVGILVAPGPGAETRRRLSEAIATALRSVLALAALPPVEPRRALTDGHGEPAPARRRRSRARRDAGAS